MMTSSENFSDLPVIANIPEFADIIDTLQGPCFRFPDGSHAWPTPRERMIIDALQAPALTASGDCGDYWAGFQVRVTRQLEIGGKHPEPVVLRGVLESIGREVEKQLKLIQTASCRRCEGRGWYLERFSDSHRTACTHSS